MGNTRRTACAATATGAITRNVPGLELHSSVLSHTDTLLRKLTQQDRMRSKYGQRSQRTRRSRRQGCLKGSPVHVLAFQNTTQTYKTYPTNVATGAARVAYAAGLTLGAFSREMARQAAVEAHTGRSVGVVGLRRIGSGGKPRGSIARS